MKHGSLFSGIGGFDLAAEWMGWDNVFHCEWMPFPRKVLHHYWPNAASYHDITTTNFTRHAGQIDILTGGFPCQPYSAAGKRKGKDDDRHLWPHMLRVIREVRPRWVVGENVFGLTTWNGGVVFDEVCADLEAEGYTVQPFVLPACAVNAPHRRDRVWFIAYAQGSDDREQTRANHIDVSNERGRNSEIHIEFARYGDCGPAADADLYGCNKRNGDNEEHASQGGQYAQRDTEQSYGYGDAADANYERFPFAQFEACQSRKNIFESNSNVSQHLWSNWPTVPPICGGDDGLPTELDGITFPKWRAESIKGYGNAIVPQVALQIFRAIEQYHNLHLSDTVR